VASSKKAKPPTGNWKEFSAWVTTLDEKQSLKELRLEAQREGGARPYVMKRYYHRWRATSSRTDLAALAVGKLPDYLK
jgi:hypothetical protein